VVTSPEATLKTVWRLPDDFFFSGSAGLRIVEGGGGGGTEKRARSWGSVSRMRDVISWLERRALVKIFGRGNLKPTVSCVVHEELVSYLRERVDALA
jgi:hypothetical protein